MELVSLTFPCPSMDTPFVIRPLGDIQYAGPGSTTAMDTLKRDIDEALTLNAWFLGMGDYIDFLSPSNRQRLKAKDLYDTALDVIDQKSLDLISTLFQEALRPTVGRWLGLLEGHHFADLSTGDTTDMRLCTMLKTRHLGSEAVIRLQFFDGKQRTHSGRHNLVLHAHHGVGGGQMQGASLNKLEHTAKAWGGIDVFLRGHDTKMPAVPINRIYPRWAGNGAPDLTHRTIHLVNTGSYAKSRMVGSRQGRVPRGGYAEQAAMNANVLGSPLLFVHFLRTTQDVGSRKGDDSGRRQRAISEFRVRVQV